MIDPDVWMRPTVKADGEKYWEYILVCVDDLLAISMRAREALEEVASTFKFKNDDISPPEMYLGGRLTKKEIDGQECWMMTSQDYVKAAVENVETYLKKKGKKLLPVNPNTPTYPTAVFDLDDTPELDRDGTKYYQELIKILRWMIELGRVDIHVNVAMSSAYQANPREGHLKHPLHMFSYLKSKNKLSIAFHPGDPRVDTSNFTTNYEEFLEQCRDAKEEIPHNVPVLNSYQSPTVVIS